ncbi:MAG: hypothetical protein ACXABK_00025 [Candidatus Heimdallarchaeaceae archaeon]
MINVTIATKNLRFLYTLNEILSNITIIKTNHILPSEPIPGNTNVIVTTEIEKKFFENKNIFIPKAFNLYYLYSNIYLKSKELQQFDSVVIGVDPGKTIGFAVIANDAIILSATEFYSVVDTVKEAISAFFNIETQNFVVKIGTGGGQIKEEILKRLNEIFHGKIEIKTVKEDFTSKNQSALKHTKLSKNTKSAILIAKR